MDCDVSYLQTEFGDPQFFYVFNIILSFSTCSQSFNNICVWEVLGANVLKFDVTWPYVKRQTAKMTPEFVFFSSNPSLNHIKIEKCLLLIATNTNILTLLFIELNTDGKSFIFAVCRLTYDLVTSNLISLLAYGNCGELFM